MSQKKTPPPDSRRISLDLDFRLVLAGGLLLTILVFLGEEISLLPWIRMPLQTIRLPLGLAYVLYVPGYCLTAALFPGAEDIDGIERTGLSLGLSVAWVSILALILDWLPWGLRLWPILLGELLSSLLFSAVALWRRQRLPAGEVYAPQMTWRPSPWWRALSRHEQRIYTLCAGALLFAGLAAAWIFLVPSPDEFMTEFYILGKEGLAEEYPRAALPGETLTVTMGIRNLERDEQTYSIEIWGVDIWEDRETQIGSVGPFTLAREEALEQTVRWTMPWAGQDQQVEFRLFSDIQSESPQEPYRRLRLWLNVDER